MPRAAITGVKELDDRLARISDDRQAKKLGRRAVLKPLRMIAASIKTEVPPATTPGHTNQRIRASIGQRFGKNRRKGIVEAKAGVSVGKRRPRIQKKDIEVERIAPHSHLLALGTVDRYTGARTYRVKFGKRTRTTGKPRRFRGRLRPNDFVARGTERVAGEVPAAMAQEVEGGLREHFAKH